MEMFTGVTLPVILWATFQGTESMYSSVSRSQPPLLGLNPHLHAYAHMGPSSATVLGTAITTAVSPISKPRSKPSCCLHQPSSQSSIYSTVTY